MICIHTKLISCIYYISLLDKFLQIFIWVFVSVY